MSDTITVRDHSQTCEHGWRWPHAIDAAKARWWREPDCLGGKEMVLRRELRTAGVPDQWCWLEVTG